MEKKIGFIGIGKMGSALAESFINKGIAGRENIIGSSKTMEHLKSVKERLGINVTTENNEVVEFSDVVFISVKPKDIKDALSSLKEKDVLYISIVAGVKLSVLESYLPKKRIARVMPNLPCVVGEMAAGYSFGNYVNEEDRKIVHELLNLAGKAFPVDEDKLDIITGLSGSGPAFISYILDAMVQAGVEEGLTMEISYNLAVQTLIGTGKMLMKIKPKELIDMVSSPNGTTVAGREILENSDVYETMKKTIKRAAERSRELGKND